MGFDSVDNKIPPSQLHMVSYPIRRRIIPAYLPSLLIYVFHSADLNIRTADMATSSPHADTAVDTSNSREKEQSYSIPIDTINARPQSLTRCWTLTDGYSCYVANDIIGQAEAPDLQQSYTVQWDNDDPESPHNFKI